MKNRLYTRHQRQPLRYLLPLVPKGTPFRKRVARDMQLRLDELATEEERQTRLDFERSGRRLWDVWFWSCSTESAAHLAGFGVVAASNAETARLVALGISHDGVILPGDSLSCGPGHHLTVKRHHA